MSQLPKIFHMSFDISHLPFLLTARLLNARDLMARELCCIRTGSGSDRPCAQPWLLALE